MTLTITARHVALTPAGRQGVRGKLKRLERLLHDAVVSTQCVLTKDRQSMRCELTVHLRGDHVFHGVGRGPQFAVAAGAAVETILPQAQRVKDRRKTHRREAAAAPARGRGPAARRGGE